MTSFKSAQLIANSHDADKVIFLTDRIELGTQSLKEYRAFAEENESVQATENTYVLLEKLKSNAAADTLIVTSIQKMSNIRDEDGGRNASDIALIGKKRLVFIVDEAHGAHLHYSKYFPVSAADLGADIVIQSFHKTLPSMTQTAVLHICSDMADVEKIKRFMGIYQTSSPSYILMASMDACMDKLRKDGQQMFREFTFNLEKARQRLSKCEKIKLIEGSMIESSGIYDFDRSKLLFSTVGTSVNGHLLHQILRDRYHIEMEMAAEKYVLGIAAVGDTEEGFERLCTAIEEIDAEIQQTDESEESQYHTSHARMTQLMTISQAVDAQQRRYSLKESVGKVSAEFAYLYPPGIPIIVPGEQITGQFVRNVRRYMEQGLEVQGLSDTSAETICVAARNEIGQEEYSPAKE